jgi:hypothetical protein
VYGGDGGFTAFDHTDPNYCYVESQYANIRRSSNGGTSFSSGVAPPDAQIESEYNFIPYFMLDPNNANRMYVCGSRIYRSNSIKSTPNWTMVKDVIVDGDSPRGPSRDHFEALIPTNSSTITVAEGNSDLVYVGYNNGQVWKTTNGTAATPTWTRIDENPGPLPNRYCSRIVVDRNNLNRVYVSFMGFAGDNVWRSVDGGNTWQDITGTGSFQLPDVPVGALAIHRTKPGWLYVGTDIGIFTSSDDGVTWSVSTDGPGTTQVSELFWRNDNTLIAATFGRGVYTATINTNEEPVSPNAYSYIRGGQTGGVLSDMFLSDNHYVSARPGVTLTSAQPPIELELSATAPISSATVVKILVETVSTAPAIIQTLSMFDYTGSQFELVDTRNIGTTDVAFELTFNTNASRFLDSTTHGMKARLSWKAGGPVLVYPWLARVDQVKWTLTP